MGRLIALLSYYDEQPAHLERLVASLATAGITHLVAVDGAYALYHNGQAASHPDQHDTLERTATEHGIGWWNHVPRTTWAGNEIEKRTRLFEHAHHVAQPGQDWLLVIDGDEHIAHPHQPADLDTTHDVLTVHHHEPGVRDDTDRRWYRAQPHGIHVRGAHHHYETHAGTVLWGRGEVAAGQSSLTIEHTPRQRTADRKQGRARYYEERQATGAEATP